MTQFDLAAALAANQPSWFKQAACRGMGPALFFVERGETAKLREAKAICARCPVTAECLELSCSSNETRAYGVWGGASAQSRKRIDVDRGMRRKRALDNKAQFTDEARRLRAAGMTRPEIAA